MTLHDADVYKCIHASECSFLVAVVYKMPDLFCCTPLLSVMMTFLACTASVLSHFAYGV